MNQIRNCMVLLFLASTVFSDESVSRPSEALFIDFGATYVNAETRFDLVKGKEEYGSFQYPGLDVGLTYQLSDRHSLSLFGDIYSEPNGFYGVSFTYGDKSNRFAIGPLLAFVDDFYTPYIGGQLWVKNVYFRSGITRHSLSEENRDAYGISYAHTLWMSLGYSIRMKRVNSRIFD